MFCLKSERRDQHRKRMLRFKRKVSNTIGKLSKETVKARKDYFEQNKETFLGVSLLSNVETISL